MSRQSQIERKSKETEIAVDINIDGSGKTSIKTGIGFLDHMLELFAFHGYFDINLEVKKGDFEIDIHHTNEDIGIVLGKAFNKALGENKSGIKRFGSGFAPMEGTLGRSIVDICGRIHIQMNIGADVKDQEGYSVKYFEHFMESFVKGIGATINIHVENSDEDLHTTLEACFKSLGLALDQATQIDPRREGEVPSTKGIID